MKHSNGSKLVRCLSLFVLALCLIARFIPMEKSAPGPYSAPKAPGAPFLNLIPNITSGLNLIGLPPAQAASETRIGVFDGEKVLALTLEDYLIGVTAAEMPASYGMEALKAQAVAARTFTIKHMTGELKCKSGHTVCTDHRCCQAYIETERMRANWGERFDEYYNKIKQAVRETDGEVLTSGGELVTALYHSSSGGKTENCEEVFAVSLPYLVSVESEGEESSPEFHSTVSYSKREFMDKINSAFPDAMMSDPEADVDIWQRTDSGRVSLIRLGGTVVSGQQLRNALSLKSTNMEFSMDGERVEISCLGFGHGVGMSQCGANAMAKQGADYREILKHYYTGVEIEPFTPDPQLWRILCGAETEGGG